jgi:ribosome-associated protein
MDHKQIVQIAVNALDDIKGENIVVIDTHSTSSLFGAIVICTGNSNRQVSALANNVAADFKDNNISIIGMEGHRGGEWVLVDGGEVVVHIMLPHVRQYYDLETLWNGQANKD